MRTVSRGTFPVLDMWGVHELAAVNQGRGETEGRKKNDENVEMDGPHLGNFGGNLDRSNGMCT